MVLNEYPFEPVDNSGRLGIDFQEDSLKEGYIQLPIRAFIRGWIFLISVMKKKKDNWTGTVYEYRKDSLRVHIGEREAVRYGKAGYKINDAGVELRAFFGESGRKNHSGPPPDLSVDAMKNWHLPLTI